MLQKATQVELEENEIRSMGKAGLYSLPTVSQHVISKPRSAYSLFDLLSAVHLTVYSDVNTCVEWENYNPSGDDAKLRCRSKNLQDPVTNICMSNESISLMSSSPIT
jgi:hypothetical protein